MSMQIKNFEIVQRLNLLKQYEDKKFPQRINYAISKNYILLEIEYQLYQKELKKIVDSYKPYYKKEQNSNEVIYDLNSLPVVDDEHHDDMYAEINELLNMQVEVSPYYISEDYFDYEDGNRYDPIAAGDIIKLQQIICEKE